jgi:DNA polymerase-3 subunit delta'
LERAIPLAFESIVGQERARKIAEAWLRSNRIPHAILLCGPEGTGKRRFALELAKALLCQQGSELACNLCPSCRKISSNVHPDLHFMLPIAAKKGRRSIDPEAVRAAVQEYMNGNALGGQVNTSIEQVRQMQRDMSYAASEGGRKVAVLLDAERMHPAGANSLLKILEEPTPESIFILVSSVPERILPTVLSRCQRLALNPLNAHVVRRQLQEMNIEGHALELGVRLGGGSVERARQIAMGEWDDLRSKVEDFIEAGLAHQDEVFWQVVEELSGDRTIQDRFLQLIAFYLRDFFLLNYEKKGSETMVDRSAYFSQFSGALDGNHIERAMLEVDRAVEALSRNASFQLVMSDLWRCLRRAGRAA